ncbi:MAG: SOS response-associated peptidase [Burkholderiaceae bacterium]
MCGRIVQKAGPLDYVETIRWNPRKLADDPAGPRYNVPPGTRPLVMHHITGEPVVDRLFWGYAPAWYKRSPVSNARMDTILDPKKSFWRGPIEHGRMIVPADGWYEWTKEGDSKVPWFIHPKDGKPILMATVSGWKPGAEPDKEHGMAIVTDDSAGGMVDIHDRRPVVLTPEDAQEWADPATPVSRAKKVMAAGRPESAFVWYRVTTKMNSTRYQLPDAIEPI